VEVVARDADGGWRLRAISADGKTREEQFDAVAVCSGVHQNPHRPHVEGEETFPGKVLHGSEYRRPDQVAGRRVLIVGAGETGADLAAEVSAHAAETVLSLRRGVAVLPRKVRGRPNDWLTCRINNSPAHWIFQTRNPADDRKRNLYRALFFPLVLVDNAIERLGRAIDGLTHLRPLLRARRPSQAAIEETRASLATRRLTKQLLRDSGGTLNEQFGTKSDEFVKAMAVGRCRRSGALARFEGRRAVFEDGSDFEPDLVILCCGFETKAPFLSEALVREPRYLHTFVPSIGGSLAFLGFARPAFGAIPPIAELQARWFALVLAGKLELPPAGEMRAAIDRQALFRRHFFRAVRGRLDYLVDFTSLCDELASTIGCKPTREAIRRESVRFRLRFQAGPFVAAQYRLVGPHAKPAIAREVIGRLPVAYRPWELSSFYLRWMLSRALHRLFGPEYGPKLVLDSRAARAFQGPVGSP
jgi:dimethylaniline monooxygenase (N-oxide forming)